MGTGGTFRYEFVPGWPRLPDGMTFGVVSDMDVDAADNVYVIDREPHNRILVFDREGNFRASWGEGTLVTPHNLWIGPDDRLHITDRGAHVVWIFDTAGKLLQTVGTPGRIGAPGEPFNNPTGACRAPGGDLYVSDGYGQQRVHRFGADGALLRSWGAEGSGPGQFGLPHDVRVAPDGRVLVTDRPNARIQVFDPNGDYLTEWTNENHPQNLTLGPDGLLYLSESEHAVSIRTLDGALLARWGVAGDGPGQFRDHPHGLCVDTRGDIYVAEVTGANRFQKFARV